MMQQTEDNIIIETDDKETSLTRNTTQLQSTELSWVKLELNHDHEKEGFVEWAEEQMLQVMSESMKKYML